MSAAHLDVEGPGRRATVSHRDRQPGAPVASSMMNAAVTVRSAEGPTVSTK